MDENSIKTMEEDQSSVVNLDFLKNAFKAFAGSLQTVINDIENDIATNSTQITETKNSITTNQNSITKNTEKINEHSELITTNINNTSSNRIKIDTNYINIQANTNAISQNTTNITTITNTINPSARPCILLVLPTNTNEQKWMKINENVGYTCTYSSTDINIDCDYVVDLNFLPTDTIDYRDQIEEEWAKITHIKVGEQGMMFYASELPEDNIPIKIKQLF